MRFYSKAARQSLEYKAYKAIRNSQVILASYPGSWWYKAKVIHKRTFIDTHNYCRTKIAFTQSMDTFYTCRWRVCYDSTFTLKMVAPSLTFLAISSLSWASDACSLSLGNLCSSSSCVTTLECRKKMVWCIEVFQLVLVFATTLAPTFSSPPPPSSPVVSVQNAEALSRHLFILQLQSNVKTM